MNNLKFVSMSSNKRGINMPYRPYRHNEILYATPGTQLFEMARAYYPRCNNSFRIKSVNINESESNHDYEIIPVGYNEPLQTSHYNLRTKRLIESKLYVPVRLLKYGVAVKSMADLKEHVVTDFNGLNVIYDDNSIAHYDSLVQILRRSDDSSKLNYFLVNN